MGREIITGVVWVRLDISKPLSRVRKIRSSDRVIGWAALEYESLPNFFYWCGLVTHDERDCEHWLCSNRTLKKEDQQFGDWMWLEVEPMVRKTSITVPGMRPNNFGTPRQKTTPPPPQNVDCTRGGITKPPGSVTAASPEQTLVKESREATRNIPDFQETLKEINEKLGFVSAPFRSNDPSFHMGIVNSNSKPGLEQESNGPDQVELHGPTTLAHQDFFSINSSGLQIKPTCYHSIPTQSADLVLAQNTTQPKRKRVLRSDIGNRKVVMCDLGSRKEPVDAEDIRPSKHHASDSNYVSPSNSTVVAVAQPHQPQ